MRGVTRDPFQECEKIHISTHTPHARRDPLNSISANFEHISTHTPHARRDIYIVERGKEYKLFQLTRLMRGVTRRSGSL